jgi:hemerythrin-like metal-binding protein
MSNPPQPHFPFELKYLVGVEALDSQHREIVNLLNELQGSVMAKKPGSALLELLTRLVNLSKTHFATEEQILRVHRYPGYLHHKAAHEGLARNLMEYRERIARRERELSLEYVDLMQLWLVDHFAAYDLEYAKFLAPENHPIEKDPNPMANPMADANP